MIYLEKPSPDKRSHMSSNYTLNKSNLGSTRDRIYKHTPGRISFEHFEMCGGSLSGSLKLVQLTARGGGGEVGS